MQTFTAFSQRYFFKFGIEQVEGKLPGISTYYTKDSYSLTNYPTLSLLIIDEDVITEGDLSFATFAMVGLLLKDENGKGFAGYNNTTKSKTNLFTVQNRKLVEYSRSKIKSKNFQIGSQIGLNYFGSGTGVRKFGMSNTGISEPDPGPYVSRMNLYGGMNMYFTKQFLNAFEMKMGTTLDANISLVTFGVSASPKVKLSYDLNFIRFNTDVSYDFDFYYARTQSAYKGVIYNVPSRTALPTALRFNVGIALRFKDK